MPSKSARAGGKYTGNHTTLIPSAVVVADIANKCEAVAKISPGFIKAGLRSAGGKRRVKITEKDAGLLLSIRGNTSHQELHIFADDISAAMAYIAKRSKAKGFIVRP